MGDILFLAHRVPFPPNRGDKIRAHHLLRKLALIGRVHVGCFAESEEDRAGSSDLDAIAASHCIINRTKPLMLAGAEAVMAGKPVSLTAFHSSRLEKYVADTVRDQDITSIVIFSGQMGQYVPEDFAENVIVDLCDVDSAKFENYADAGERIWLNRREGKLLAREEERLARRASATILISESEAQLFRDRLAIPALANLHVIGNGIDAAFFDPDKITPHPVLASRPGPHLVFTGQMDYRPNEQAAMWIIGEVLLTIREMYPSAEFHVVGRNPTPLLEGRSCDGLSVWGEVPDVRPFLKGADCVLAPLLIARGIQNKVLEAMAMQCPVLLTPEAATGIEALDGEHWVVSEANSQAFCAKMDHILRNETKRRRMAEAAREFVLHNHVWDTMLEPLLDLVNCSRPVTSDAA